MGAFDQLDNLQLRGYGVSHSSPPLTLTMILEELVLPYMFGMRLLKVTHSWEGPGFSGSAADSYERRGISIPAAVSWSARSNSVFRPGQRPAWSNQVAMVLSTARLVWDSSRAC